MPVIERARLVLTKLEAEDRGSQARAMMDDLPLFAITARETPQAPSVSDELSAALAAINPDDLTPREALEALYALKTKAAKKN
jgi:DNA mismatch repair protein MutS